MGYLLDEIRLHGESAESRDEITELARRYGIVTPYTAYLIVEDETRRNVPLPMQSLPQFHADHAARKCRRTIGIPSRAKLPARRAEWCES